MTPSHTPQPDETLKVDAAARRAALAAARAAASQPPAHPDGAPANASANADLSHPEANPQGWDRDTSRLMHTAPNHAPYGTKEELAAYVATGRSNGRMLDDLIYQMRLSGMGPHEIARKLGPNVSVEFVQAKIAAVLQSRQQLTPSEYRWLQLARLDTIINALWNGMQAGIIENATVILSAIERANKMMELEKETTRVEIELISDGQADVLKRTLAIVLEAVLNVPAIRAVLDTPTGDADLRTIVDGTVSAALTEAAAIIDDARVLELEATPHAQRRSA